MDRQMITKDRRLRWGTMTRMEDEVRMREELEEVRSRGWFSRIGFGQGEAWPPRLPIVSPDFQGWLLAALEAGGGCHYLALAVSFGR